MYMSLFDGTNNKAKQVVEGNLFDILDGLYNSHSYKNKEDALLICPSVFDGTRRLENLLGSFAIALDIDEGITLEETVIKLNELNLTSYIYTTPSSKNFNKFRVFIPTDKMIETPRQYKNCWKVLYEYLNQAPDRAPSHAASLFYIPAHYAGADNEVFKLKGQFLRVNLFNDVGAELFDEEAKAWGIQKIKLNRKPTKINEAAFMNIQTCPIIKQYWIDEYLQLPRNSGQHHIGLYKFMVRVAAASVKKGIDIQPFQIAELARQLDDFDGGKQQRKGRNLVTEANNALDFALSRVEETK